MKRYLLFAGSCYYPSGGWSDFENSFDTLEEAVDAAESLNVTKADWAHIIDKETGKKLWEQ